MIESALFAYLSSYVGLSALVGTRVYPLVLPQTPTMPAIAYNRVSSVVERDLSGAARTRVRMQLTCFGTTYGSAKQVARQVREALQDYSGTMGAVRILEATVIGEMDQYEPDLSQYYIPVDVMFLIEGGTA